MVYFKTTDENGFVSVSTLNADEGGNSTKTEHDTIAEMYRSAEAGYGVVETGGVFAYAKRPELPPVDGDADAADYESALSRLGVEV